MMPMPAEIEREASTSTRYVSASIRLTLAERRRVRLLADANEIQFYARELGREGELRAEIDRAWANLGLAAAEAEAAELELESAKRALGGRRP